MKRVRSLEKLPKRKVTVDDILGCEDIMSVIGDLEKDHLDFNEILVIASTEDGLQWRHSGMSLSRLIYVMEKVKSSLLLEDK